MSLRDIPSFVFIVRSSENGVGGGTPKPSWICLARVLNDLLTIFRREAVRDSLAPMIKVRPSSCESNANKSSLLPQTVYSVRCRRYLIKLQHTTGHRSSSCVRATPWCSNFCVRRGGMTQGDVGASTDRFNCRDGVYVVLCYYVETNFFQFSYSYIHIENRFIGCTFVQPKFHYSFIKIPTYKSILRDKK